MQEVEVVINNRENRFPKGITILEAIKKIGGRLVKEALAAKINGSLVDLTTPLEDNVKIDIITYDLPEGLEIYRHSTSHIMAQAVKRLFNGVKLGIGPAIKDGFYYDFDFPGQLSAEDLERIEQEMEKIIKEDLPFTRIEVSKDECISIFQELQEDYKVELIQNLPEDETITCYKQGEFIDLCTGPHVPSTGKIKAFKLLSIAGAYWRGDEQRPMLQRIYGTSFPNKKSLEEHLVRLEEAKQRDHRRLGRELELFSFHEDAPGFPFFHPNGVIIWNELIKFWREEHRKAGYMEIKTPVILNRRIWEQSGHWEHYKDNMYFTVIDNQDYAIKPMNCPGAIIVYKSKMHSYRELPIRVAELGLVHRHELSGTLHGLMRLRNFTQDDAHIFMLPEQVEDEVIGLIELIDYFYSVFGFQYDVELSTKPSEAMGSEEMWEKATGMLKNALDKLGKPYSINKGEGAFYGPKIDFHLKDSLDRAWQCGTIQLDFQMPEKFDLTYIGQDGQKHRPVMIHRVVYGAIERFLALLIEHYGGALPIWLAPVQAVVIPITERHRDYAFRVYERLAEEGVRVEFDDRSEKVGYKIREGQVKKIPYMLIIGDKEVNEKSVSVRERGRGDLGPQPLEEFVRVINTDIKLKN